MHARRAARPPKGVASGRAGRGLARIGPVWGILRGMLPGAFGALPADVQAQVTASGRVGRWGRGELLFHPEDPAEALFVLLRGSVRLYRLGTGAREVTLDVHGAGALLCAAALLPGEQCGMYAEAMDDAEALLLGRDVLGRLTQAQPAVAVALTEQITRQTRGVQERLSGLVFLEVSQRLALALLNLAEREGPGRRVGRWRCGTGCRTRIWRTWWAARGRRSRSCWGFPVAGPAGPGVPADHPDGPRGAGAGDAGTAALIPSAARSVWRGPRGTLRFRFWCSVTPVAVPRPILSENGWARRP